jgi:Response regulators consisting of a CheY-like receiver domain and a winged-helix DNA-binding domain
MPFHVNELFERVSNDIQQELKNKKSIINFITFSYDFNSRSLFDSKNSLRFTEKENEIFSCLLNYKNEPVSKKQLLKDIWQYDDQIDTHTLETHVYSLRKKLESKLGKGDFLNHFDEGYQLDTSICRAV